MNGTVARRRIANLTKKDINHLSKKWTKLIFVYNFSLSSRREKGCWRILWLCFVFTLFFRRFLVSYFWWIKPCAFPFPLGLAGGREVWVDFLRLPFMASISTHLNIRELLFPFVGFNTQKNYTRSWIWEKSWEAGLHFYFQHIVHFFMYERAAERFWCQWKNRKFNPSNFLA